MLTTMLPPSSSIVGLTFWPTVRHCLPEGWKKKWKSFTKLQKGVDCWCQNLGAALRYIQLVFYSYFKICHSTIEVDFWQSVAVRCSKKGRRFLEIFIELEDQLFPRYEKRFSYEGGGVNPLVRGGLRSGGQVPGGLGSGGQVSSIRGGALGSKLSPSPPPSCEDGESSNSMAEQEP